MEVELIHIRDKHGPITSWSIEVGLDDPVVSDLLLHPPTEEGAVQLVGA